MPRPIALLFASLGALALAATPAETAAETVAQALAQAYQNNPQINAARADTRVADESVPLAKSARRPTISGFGSITGNASESGAESGGVLRTDSLTRGSTAFGLSAQQTLFRGFRTRNAIAGAQAGVLASRQFLDNTVQAVLFDAATAYMDIVRDSAILGVRRQTVGFLEEQVRAAEERFEVGETTRTDVAQTRARLSASVSEVVVAEASLRSSQAVYRQVVGSDPRNLQSGFPFANQLPGSLPTAIDIGQRQHPGILASLYLADSAAFAVKEVEGELLPTVSLEANAQRQDTLFSRDFTNSASISGRVSIPIYQGGAVAARVRQAKETLGLRKIEVDVTRDQVRAATVSAWVQLDAAKASILAASAQVEASNIALAGVQEEQAVGQRTTLDVLNAQQELLNARVALISAQRDRVVAAFAVLSAVGRLRPEFLGLGVPIYRPEEHYEEVEDKWYGLRTPDGR